MYVSRKSIVLFKSIIKFSVVSINIGLQLLYITEFTEINVIDGTITSYFFLGNNF